MFQTIVTFGMFMGIVMIFGVMISPFYSRRRKYFFLGLALSKILSGTCLALINYDMWDYSWAIFILSKFPQFFIGPFYYLLFGAIFGYHSSWTKDKLLHFTPVAVTCFVLIFFALFKGLLPGDGISTVLKLINVFQCLHILIYYFLTAYNLYRIGEKRIEVSIGIIFTAAYSIGIVFVLIGLLAVDKSFFLRFLTITMAYDCIVFMVHYIISYRYPSMRPFSHPLHEKIAKKTGAEKNLNSFDYAGIEKKLKDLFDIEKIYLMEDLTLGMLARELGIRPYQLSHYLNSRLGKNFNSLVNSYRVEEAQSLLTGDTRKSIITIAFETGFNSKSSFNRIFQNQTGMTPSDYREKITARDDDPSPGHDTAKNILFPSTSDI